MAQDGPRLSSFGGVDASNDAERLIAWVDWIEGLPQVNDLRKRSYELLGLAPGATAVDVGCGTGRAVADLASTGVAATGYDASESMIEMARRRFPGLDFRIGTAERLPVETASVQGYRAERLYQHLTIPAAGLAEVNRVLALGGRIVIVDLDYDTIRPGRRRSEHQ